MLDFSDSSIIQIHKYLSHDIKKDEDTRCDCISDCLDDMDLRSSNMLNPSSTDSELTKWIKKELSKVNYLHKKQQRMFFLSTKFKYI